MHQGFIRLMKSPLEREPPGMFFALFHTLGSVEAVES